MYLPDCPACIAHADNGALGGFEWSDEHAHTCGWVNEDCPASCCTEHDEPYSDRYTASFECPQTGGEYEWCDRCREWSAQSYWSSEHVRIGNEWLCDPYAHGFTTCDDCGGYVNESSTRYFEVDDGYEDGWYLCPDCYSEREREQERRSQPAPVRPTSCCGEAPNYLDELTERFVCKCQADELRKQRKPVLAVAA